MITRELIKDVADLQEQYENQHSDIPKHKLYPKIWDLLGFDQFETRVVLLKDAIQKGVLLEELDSVRKMEKEYLDKRVKKAIEIMRNFRK